MFGSSSSSDYGRGVAWRAGWRPHRLQELVHGDLLGGCFGWIFKLYTAVFCNVRSDADGGGEAGVGVCCGVFRFVFWVASIRDKGQDRGNSGEATTLVVGKIIFNIVFFDLRPNKCGRI